MHEMPAAFELVSIEVDDEMSLGELLVRFTLRRPPAAIPTAIRSLMTFSSVQPRGYTMSNSSK